MELKENAQEVMEILINSVGNGELELLYSFIEDVASRQWGEKVLNNLIENNNKF
jgi:hypothetical protein